MKQSLLKFSILLCLLLVYESTIAQLAKCKGKYLGNILQYSVPGNYNTYWNQATSENGSKWGSVEGTKGVYNFSNSDLAYNWAKNNNGLFKYHNFVWGGQTPGWVASASTATIMTAVQDYIKACSTHYTPMGGLKLIDVLNEPVNTPMPGNMKAALTAGYQAEPANAADKNNTYGWAIWCFQLARKYFPDATLLINEYNIEMNWGNCRAPYIAMVNAIKNAPNLTDGRKNLIDGVGLQCHGIGGLSAANFKACIDEIWNKTGVPVHITEFDQTADPDESKQQAVYSSLIPVAWEHPHVAGITLWGYIQGSTWIGGNGAAGPSGTDSGLLYKSSYSNPYGERPAMTWLKSYFASKSNLSCCPAPAPFAACNGDAPPSVSITAPATNASFTAPASINITASASDPDGTIAKVDFYNGTTLLGSDNSSPYSYNWSSVAAGTYTLTAVATDNSGSKTTSEAVTIKVNVPQGPYNGTAHVIPGTIQFEEYDAGGNGYAYYDATAGNTGGASFRTDEDVDIENCTDAGGGYNIGWATAGEWLEYTVNVQTTGVYNMDLRVACNGDGRTLSVSMDGTSIASNVAIPNTADWQTWQTVRVSNISLTAGQKIMRLTIGATDYINLNYVTFSLSTPPVATITAAGATTFCAGGSVLLNASTGTGYTYQWKKDGNSIASATSSSYTATESGSYTVAVSANSQTVTSEAVSVTAKAIPAAPVVSTPVTYCQNATASPLTATGSNLKWYTVQSGGTGSAIAPTPSTSAAGSNTYYVSQTENGCEGARAAIAVTVNLLPVITPYVQTNGGAWLQQSTAQLCAGGSVVLGPQPVTATGWSWTGPNGFTSASREVSLANITAGQGGVYTAIYTTNGCSATQTFNITVNAVPDAPVVTSPVSYCVNATANALTATGTGLKWYTVATGGTSSSTAPTPSTTTVGTTNYYVSQTTNGCESSRAMIAVTVNTAPNAPVVTSPVTYCQNVGAAPLTATGSDLKWYTVQIGGTSSATAPTPSTATAGTTSYYVSQTANGCESSRAMIAVTVNTAPTAPVVTSPVTYCQNASAAQLTATGSDLKWYTVQSGGTSSATAPTPSTATAGTTSYYVSQTANGCESSRAMIAVTVNTAPTAPVVTSPVTYCQNASAAQLTATGSDLKWYTVQSGGTSSATAPTPSTTTAGTTNYYVSQSTNGCESARATIAVTVNALPDAVITPSGPTTFNQGSSVVLSANTGTGLSYKWFNGSTQVGTDNTYTATSGGNYTVEVSNTSGCKATSSVVTVTVNGNQAPVVIIDTPSDNSAFIAPATIAITATATDTDGTIAKVEFYNGSTLLGSDDSAPYVFTWSNVATGTYQITAKATDNNGAVSTSAVVTIKVNVNQPSVITIISPVNNFTITESRVTINVTATDTDGSITLVEYLDNGTVIGTSTTAPYTFVTDSLAPGIHAITVRVTDSNGGVTTSAPVSEISLVVEINPSGPVQLHPVAVTGCGPNTTEPPAHSWAVLCCSQVPPFT